MLIKTLLISVLMVGSVCAQTGSPDKPITLVQGFGTGGNSDTIARIIAPGLSKELGQQVIVEAKTGAGGNIASAAVAKAPLDGNTLILLTGGHAVSAALYNQLSFNPIEDFDWISLVTQFPFAVSVSEESKFKSLVDVIKAAKAMPDSISYTSVGIGSTQHLSGELFKAMTGCNMLHVPYKGAGPALIDLTAGQVQVFFDNLPSSVVHIKGGRIRALGVTSEGIEPSAPELPTVGATVKGYEATAWFGIGMPKNTPPDVIAKMNAEVNKALADPVMQKRLAELGGISIAGTPADFGKIIADETAKWAKVVEISGAKVE
jgi:tripartite-type tricarboxylate transporter receptor subunit TctC